MRILHVIPTYLPAWRHGGPVYAVHGLAKAQAQAGHHVEVFTTNVHGEGRLEVPTGVEQAVDGVGVTYFPVTFPHRLHRAPAMAEVLAERVSSFEVLHLHSLFLWPTFAAARAAERARVPYLVAPRGMLVEDLIHRRGRLRKRLWLAAVERRTLERAAAIHVTGALEAEEGKRFGWRLPRIVEVPNGLDAAELTLAEGASTSAAIADQISRGVDLLFLGRVSWKKGLDRLLPALPLLPRARLVVAGNDEEGLIPRLRAQAATLGVSERVSFVGPVAGADKAALLAAARCFVLPSYSENFGNAVLEAMAVGLPVVVTPEVGLAATVEAAGAGRVVPGDSALWAAALGEILGDENLRRELGQGGRQVVAEHFGWAAIAARMVEIYRELVEYPSRHG
jgi:glycosyltransferase involved in cell wall biosynthesis